MNNNDKLLRALIDTLGFDIEEVENFDEKGFDKALVNSFGGHRSNFMRVLHFGFAAKLLPLRSDYTIIEYKLVKRAGMSDAELVESLQYGGKTETPNNIDWEFLGFANRDEAHNLYTKVYEQKMQYPKATFVSFDEWVEAYRQSKISLALSR